MKERPRLAREFGTAKRRGREALHTLRAVKGRTPLPQVYADARQESRGRTTQHSELGRQIPYSSYMAREPALRGDVNVVLNGLIREGVITGFETNCDGISA